MKNICIVTATRAEYGLLKPLMELLKNSESFNLQIIATGAHMSPEFGLTYEQIEADGFTVDEKIEILMSSDTAAGIVKSMGIAMISFAEVFDRIRCDLLVLLGDRYEMLAIASAATIFKIPIAHLHGGEITEGAYDDAVRHAITKLSHLHFTSTEVYRQRVIQMGENPSHVFNVGAIGLDNVRNLEMLTRQDLEENFGVQFKKYIYQITFHPETLEDITSKEQFKILLQAIEEQKESTFVFTKANADTDGRIINQMIDDFVSKFPEKCIAFHSLGTLRFLSLVYISTAIVGNSSSGIIEAPSLNTPTINIGSRQQGRVQADSVLNVACNLDEIVAAFDDVKSESIQHRASITRNPYENGGAADSIFAELTKNLDLRSNKTFYNIV